MALLAVLAGFEIAVLSALWIFNERLGVHVTGAGIKSIGSDGKRAFGWDQITTFCVNRRAATWAVEVTLVDGKTVRLASTAGWSWQRSSVERMKRKLDLELDHAVIDARAPQR